jgi:aspartyl protease family protein
MEILIIGRDIDNDVVINDNKVSRHHLQIIKKGTNDIRIVDLNSTNGTFVNDRKISGETTISYKDIVRIGDSVLPWKTYFPNKTNSFITQNKIHRLAWTIGIAVILTVIIINIYPQKETIIKMREENGVCYVPVKINGQELDFIFDTGASNILISTLEALILIKNGTLTNNDVKGTDKFIDATGKISEGAIINLKTVKIGDVELTNIKAIVIENPNALCLLGQTVLSQFGTYKIDNIKKEIIFK